MIQFDETFVTATTTHAVHFLTAFVADNDTFHNNTSFLEIVLRKDIMKGIQKCQIIFFNHAHICVTIAFFKLSMVLYRAPLIFFTAPVFQRKPSDFSLPPACQRFFTYFKCIRSPHPIFPT
jgi:hypothetical protein